jgi:hypothetical protein
MIRLAPLMLLAAAGCDFDFELDFNQSEVGLYSSAGGLVITGCSNGGLFGCGDSAETGGRMEVVIDGLRYEVPMRKPGLFDLFPAVGFEWAVKSPENPFVEAAFAGGTWVKIEELPWFDLEVDGPEGVVARSGSSVPLVFDAFRGASLSVSVTTTCAGREFPISEHYSRPRAETAGENAGRFDLPLTNAAFVGACTHDVALAQEVYEQNDDDYYVTVGRTVHQLVDTLP